MDQAREYIDFTLDNKHADAENALKSMLSQRVTSALDERKRQVADQLYNRAG